MDTKKSDKRRFYAEINDILKQWNPIGVHGPALEGEYLAFVPSLAQLKQSSQRLRNRLKEIVEECGGEYDPHNQDHVKDIEDIAARIESLSS